MRTLIRRLRKLEERGAPQVLVEPGWLGLLRERRRRRAEAAGEPYIEQLRVPIDPALFANGRWPTWAEVLRSHRARRSSELRRPCPTPRNAG
jgi:hypothetical protein